MRLAMVVVLGLVLAFATGVQQQGPQLGKGLVQGDVINPGARFEAVDVFMDSGAVPLGAWQVEIKAVNAGEGRSVVKLVGVEGGVGVYKDPPYYDPAALHENQIQERIVLAAFSTAADLPAGRTRVARLHVQVTGPQEPEYVVKLMTAGAADGTKIEAKAIATPVDAGAPGDGR